VKDNKITWWKLETWKTKVGFKLFVNRRGERDILIIKKSRESHGERENDKKGDFLKREREKEGVFQREREKVEVGRELDWIFWRKQNTTSKTHFKARWELRGA
jgi:hypothetical protein